MTAQEEEQSFKKPLLPSAQPAQEVTDMDIEEKLEDHKRTKDSGHGAGEEEAESELPGGQSTGGRVPHTVLSGGKDEAHLLRRLPRRMEDREQDAHRLELRQVHYEQMRKSLPPLFTMHYKYDASVMADLREAEIFRVDVEADAIEEDEMIEIWRQVEEADRAEIQQFTDEKAFKKICLDYMTSEMILIDARWVRKWKRLPDKKRKVKSRLCARGFMDSQKSLLATRSTTATRLSQRMLVSNAARGGYTLESWDIAGAS